MRKTLAVLSVLVASPLLAAAEAPFKVVDTVVLNARIEVIDHDARELTVVDGSGNSETVQLGPEVEGFDRLKVGDTVAFRHYESVVYAIRKPQEPRVLPSRRAEAVDDPAKDPNRSAILSRQQTATLTIVSVDAEAPSLTVLTEDGRRLSFRPFRQEDVERLEVGDLMDITYTQALVISVLSPTAPRQELSVAIVGQVHP